MPVNNQDLTLQGTPRFSEDTDSDGTAENDINSGAATLYFIAAQNNNSSSNFFKCWNNASPTVGTTTPVLVFRCSANSSPILASAFGISFATALSTGMVSAGGTGGTTSPTNSVRVVLSLD